MGRTGDHNQWHQTNQRMPRHRIRVCMRLDTCSADMSVHLPTAATCHQLLLAHPSHNRDMNAPASGVDAGELSHVVRVSQASINSIRTRSTDSHGV